MACIGKVLGKQKKYDDSLKYLFKSYKALERMNADWQVYEVLIDIGKNYFELAEYKKAIKHIKKGLNIAVELACYSKL
jgi:tetratricopeptide (TPR) repeat protein